MKKQNPRNKPATQKDVERAYQRGSKDGCGLAMAIFFTVLCDKFNGGDYIIDVWSESEKLSEAIKEHRVNLFDLVTVLRDEYGIELKD